LETFNGYPGDPSQWIDSMGLHGIVDKAVASHLRAPAIIVSPTIEFPPGVDTECVDGTGTYPRVETWVSRDIPDWVLHTFRAEPDRDTWATIGLSAGGWCAALATMRHPRQYVAAIVLGDLPLGPDLLPVIGETARGRPRTAVRSSVDPHPRGTSARYPARPTATRHCMARRQSAGIRARSLLSGALPTQWTLQIMRSAK
jgi:hypothetical protein